MVLHCKCDGSRLNRYKKGIHSSFLIQLPNALSTALWMAISTPIHLYHPKPGPKPVRKEDKYRRHLKDEWMLDNPWSCTSGGSVIATSGSSCIPANIPTTTTPLGYTANASTVILRCSIWQKLVPHCCFLNIAGQAVSHRSPLDCRFSRFSSCLEWQYLPPLPLLIFHNYICDIMANLC